jgi:DNA mismatch endonuclease (patch repair protein)
MVFTRAKVVVFLDGCFWHGCPVHHTVAKTHADYWADKVRQNRLRDVETDRLLTEAGWQVLRVWEHEDPAGAAKRVAIAVRERRSQPDCASIAKPDRSGLSTAPEF